MKNANLAIKSVKTLGLVLAIMVSGFTMNAQFLTGDSDVTTAVSEVTKDVSIDISSVEFMAKTEAIEALTQSAMTLRDTPATGYQAHANEVTMSYHRLLWAEIEANGGSVQEALITTFSGAAAQLVIKETPAGMAELTHESLLIDAIEMLSL